MPEQEIDVNVAENPTRKKLIPIVIVAGLMIVEAVGIFVAMKTLGTDPQPAEAATGEGIGPGETPADAMDVELVICELDAYNKQTGRLLMIHLEVVVVVSPDEQERFEKLIELRQNTIDDRVTTIIRSADPKYLNEPQLETIRRQIKFELDKIVGSEDLIHEVLIPKLLQSASNL
jgi:flagellar basal body-associated protein FliL